MKVIIASGPSQSFGAIVIDHVGQCFWRDGERVAFGRRGMFRFISAVLVSWPRYVSDYEAADHVWGDDCSGGPMCTQSTLSVRVVHHGEKIARLGVAIHSLRDFGWRAYEPHEAGYRSNHAQRKRKNDCTTGTSATRDAASPATNSPGAGGRSLRPGGPEGHLRDREVQTRT